MTIRTLPDPILRARCAAVTTTCGLDLLSQQLVEQMQRGAGSVGIAAPQIGTLQRVITIDCRKARHRCANHGLLTMVNPKIISSSGHKLGREGCLSVPDWVATVERATKISVEYQDCTLRWHSCDATGFEARVIQHEIDHLDGILFIDRITSTRDMVRRIAADIEQ
ncbi:MAG: peptide deformylase [Mariprofundales bacterium]|nr:peptide deformylase [Mariprofundales bacterium]